MVLSKYKSDTKTQFINTSGDAFYRKETNNNILTTEHIEEIMKRFDSKEDVEYITKSVENDKIVAEIEVSTLFEVGFPAISKHFKNIFEEGELEEKVVISILETTTEHGSIEGKTAAEIIGASADKTKENMGLTIWKNTPDGRILKSDVTVGKNYLEERQIRQLYSQ